MKKIFLLLGLFLPLGAVSAAQLPQNVYFRAMADEMQRTKKQLRVPGAVKPFFTVYRLTESESAAVSSVLGVPAQSIAPERSVSAQVYMYAGDAQNNSSGFLDAHRYGFPSLVQQTQAVPLSYEGIRRALWKLTDLAYVQASGLYEKKKDYKRRKGLKEQVPDFSSAPRAAYTEEADGLPPIDWAAYQNWANELSSMAKKYPYIEQFSVQFSFQQDTRYFLDSLGDFYQISRPKDRLVLTLVLRTKKGYREGLKERLPLPRQTPPDPAAWNEAVQQLLQQAQQLYTAEEAEPYVGPVLLRPAASAKFFDYLFSPAVSNTRSWLSDDAWLEKQFSGGKFKDKLGMRVMSSLFDVYDRPQLRSYKGQPLAAFMPVDDEGVTAQELQLVKDGKLTALPQARGVSKKGQKPNGRGRMFIEWPRASVTNLFFVPKQPLSAGAMEANLLARCRELDLPYCYILPSWQLPMDTTQTEKEIPSEIIFAERIYTQDGRKETVHGLKFDALSTRSLRDITAAGDDAQAFAMWGWGERMASVVAPSILVEEMELVPTERKPAQKPFVSQPR